MSSIVDFRQYIRDRGCKGCSHLLYIDKDTAVCDERDWTDGTKIYPIVDGKHKLPDWGACENEAYCKKTASTYKKYMDRYTSNQ